MKAPTKPFALCIDNTDYRASLIPRKVYRIVPDPRAAKDDLVRIVVDVPDSSKHRQWMKQFKERWKARLEQLELWLVSYRIELE